MKLASTAAAVLCISLAACGDDGGGGGGGNTPDASMQPQPDARVCGSLTAGATQFVQYDESGYLEWAALLDGTLADGNQLFYRFEIYNGIEPSLTGTFDLASGNQGNYSTCAICIRAFPTDQNVQKQYFQSGGTITLTEDPFTNKHLKATITGLTLQEVTVAANTFVSTPVAGGACGNIADHSVDRDRVPDAWTCTRSDYDNGGACNCMCGVSDPDCQLDNAAVQGCTTQGDVCFNDACVTPPTNDTCATAMALTPGQATSGSTAGAGRNYSSGLEGASCTGFAQNGPDVVYSLTLGAGDTITATLSGLATGYDGSIALVGPGDATICDASPITTCVKGADAATGNANETFTFTVTDAGNYFIIVDSYRADIGGAFTLTATVTPP